MRNVVTFIRKKFKHLPICTQAGLLSFLLTIGLSLSFMLSAGIWPFGDSTLMINDAIHQYLPFHSLLQRKLSGRGSLFYSFSGGFGFNLWAVVAYYLSSPFNLILAIIPKENVVDFMDIAIMVKVSLCSGLFSWYLAHRGNKRLLPAILGLGYGLSTFIVSYQYNIMWLDSLFIFPVVLYGIEKLIKEKKSSAYLISLCYAIWCNYYIGFMICIFCVMYFLVLEAGLEDRQKEERIEDVKRFIWISLLAGGICAVLLIPAFKGLTLCASVTKNSFPLEGKFYTDLATLLGSHFFLTKPVSLTGNRGVANIYCGVIAVPGALMYLQSKQFSKKERLAKLLLCAFFLISFSFNILNYIWHGFHFQFGLPNRFAFLYIAMLLIMTYDALSEVSEIPAKNILVSFIIPVGFTIWQFISQWKSPDLDEMQVWSCSLTVVFLLVYLAILLFIKRTRKEKCFRVLLMLVMLELMVNFLFAQMALGTVPRSFFIENMDSYQHLIAQTEDKSCFRSENGMEDYMRDAVIYSGGMGTTLFSSVMDCSVTNLCDQLGIQGLTNKTGSRGYTKIMHDLFGVKYLLSEDRKAQTLNGFDIVGGYGRFDLYQNENALSIGYMVDKDVLECDLSNTDNPFEAQNLLIEKAVGIADFYSKAYEFSLKNNVDTSIADQPDCQTYVYLVDNVENLSVNTPEYEAELETFGIIDKGCFYIGTVGEDNNSYLKAVLENKDQPVTGQVWTCDEGKYEEVVSILAENQLDVSEMKGNLFRGSINTDKSGILLLTIPCDPGWKIVVDGKKVKPAKVLNTFIGLELDKGSHTIQMKYTPPGFVLGMVVSIISLYVTFGYFLYNLSPEEKNFNIITSRKYLD